jgi:putative Mg2+ transporter-C (MgtC) family protein
MGIGGGIVTVLREQFGDLADVTDVARVVLRLLLVALLGGLVGWQRERSNKPAGTRTHMLVALGAAVFILASQRAGMDAAALSRVVQGLATGVGFVGAGAILKQGEHVEGLTTAAALWLAAAVGTAAGLASGGVAVLASVLGWVVLEVLGRFEKRSHGTFPDA